jgi:thiamine transport system permease protein
MLSSREVGRSIRPASKTHHVLGIALSLLFLLPYLTLAFHWEIADLLKGDFTREIVPAFWISFRLAFWTSCFAVLLGLLGVWVESRNRFFSQLGSIVMVIPAGVSVMVLGIGFFIAYANYLDPFSASVWPIIFLQAIFFVPVTFRVFQPISKRREKGAWDAALTLGASPLKAFVFVEWPRWRRPILSVAALVAGAACGEVAAVSLFYSEGRVPAAFLVSRWMSQYRFGEALTLSLLLTCVSAALVSAGFLGSPEVRHD